MKRFPTPLTRIRIVLLAASLLCLNVVSGFAQTTLTNGLVAYWPLDTIINGNMTPDLALGNNMTLFGSPPQVTGERGNAFSFNGTSQYIDIMHSTNFLATGLPIYTTNGYTIAFWVQGVSTQAANKIPFSEVAYAGSMLLDFNTRSTKIAVFLRNNAGTTVINNIQSSTPVFDTTGTNWHHVAFTDLNGTCKLYIDGNADSANVNYTAPSAGAPAATITTVAALIRSSGFADGFIGSVDEVMGWNRILSQAEIQSAMSNGIPGPIQATAPIFVTQPASSTNAMGDHPIFSSIVFGNQPMSYQWYSNNIALIGQTNSSLALNNLITASTNTYSLLASNIGGTNMSNPATLVVLADPPATNIDSGLVGYWPFDVVTNSASPDLVSQNDMQLTGSPGLVSGKFSDAISFDGATQYGSETTGTPIYAASTTYSVAFWVNGAGSQSGYRIIFANGNPANGNYFLIGNDPGGTTGRLDVRANPGTVDTLSTNTALDGTWHHVAWVDQNGTGLLYIDGVLDPTVYNYARSGSLTVSNTTVGALVDAASPQYYFAGDVDDLGTWNRRLTYTEIQSIVAHGIPTPPVIVKPTVGTPAVSESPVYQGDSLTISAITSGTSPSFQWYFGTNKISGVGNPSALTSALSLTDVQPAQSGTYSLVASNSAGSATNSVALTVTPYTPVTNGTAVQVEFNWATLPVVQPGFGSMTLNSNPSSFNGPEITVSPIGATFLSDRTRSVPTNNPPAFTTADIYQQFIFSGVNSPGTGIDVLVQRLAPNTVYGLTMWSYDQENSGLSDWTEVASGTAVSISGYPYGLPVYDFTGSMLPAADYDDTFGALLTSSSTGKLEIQGVQDPSSPTLSVFINAIRLVANPGIQITGESIAADGNLQLTVATQYPWQTIHFQESPNLASGSWVDASDATVTATHGPILTAEFPLSSTQLFYRVVSP